jgi:hypothetical protein
MGLRFYRWHSFNILPHLTLCGLYYDPLIQETGQLVELVLFGVVFHLTFRSRRAIYWDSRFFGPLYSRRRKVWYWAPQLPTKSRGE